MSVRIKLIQDSKFRVCRFCLHGNANDLSSFYEKIDGDVIAINQTIRSALALLEIQVGPSDAYPKLICINCRDMLISMQHFKINAQKSIKLLEKVMAMQKPAEVKAENDSDEYTVEDRGTSPVDVVYEELLTEVLSDDIQELDESITDVKEEIEVATTMLSFSMSAPRNSESMNNIEESYLNDGYIPIQEGEIKIYHKQKKPKIRKPAPPKICQICGIQTTAIAVHMRTHSSERPFACDMCDLKFYTNGKLRCHIDSVHIAERKFSCEVCGKAFVLKKNLNAHIMSHSAKREHTCSQCSKSFLFRWSLTAHERIHTGERPFACSWQGCEKTFVSVSNLIQHQKTTNHWNKSPVEVCSLCDKAFQTKAALKAHRTKVHGTEIYLDNVTIQ